MGNFKKAISFGLLILTVQLLAESGGDSESGVRLYQVGKAGKYCLSITRDESGCISGAGAEGNPINVLDFIRGRKVVFENLSDAPHDMKFSGTNADEIPPQAPQGPIVGKQMVNVDNSVSKITCSFHGDQLGVGYKVPEAKPIDQLGVPGHNDRSKAPGEALADGDRGTPTAVEASRPVMRTGLADVAEKALQKSRPEDVARLIANRPELMGKLKEIRPLLAEELSSDENLRKVIAKASTSGSSAASSTPKTNETGFGGVDTARQKGLAAGASGSTNVGVSELAARQISTKGLVSNGVVKTDFGTVTTYNLKDREVSTETTMRVDRLLQSGNKGKSGKNGQSSAIQLRSLASLENNNQGGGRLFTNWYWMAIPFSLVFFWIILKRKKEETKG